MTTQPGDSTWYEIIAAIGTGLSPFVAYLVADRTARATIKSTAQQARTSQETTQKQVQATVISSNRQRWIDAVRDDIATFIAELEIVRHALSVQGGASQSRAELIRSLRSAYERVRMRLNPAKSDQRAIIDTMTTVLSDLNSPEVPRLTEQLVSQAQVLFKRVWDQVKAGG